MEAHWNFPMPFDEIFGESDTVGAVAVDREGRYAVANSTGGASPMLAGRIGDSPIIGCGFYAGRSAAIATTGIGEEIIRRTLARNVHDSIFQGEEVARACDLGVVQYSNVIPIGIIAISRRGWSSVHNRDMATATRVKED
jgi:L-asparaginase/beta-aspartyl-peptidase (threonine type)